MNPSMASTPQFYYDFTFPTDFSELLPPAMAAGEGTLAPFFDGFFVDRTISPFEPSEALLSTIDSMCPHQQQYEVADAAVLALPELNNASTTSYGIGGVGQNFCVEFQPDQLYEFGEECFGLVPDLNPVYHPVSNQNWEIPSNQATAIEDSNMKVSRYSEEVRKERILRYLKKRNQRNFNKTIKYACRKTLADRRIRVRGRFARNNNEPCHQEINIPQKNDTSFHKDVELYNHNAGDQMKKDEDEWLEEITSLMYLPCITS